MRYIASLALPLGALALAGCGGTPQEERAQEIEASAAERAEAIEESAADAPAAEREEAEFNAGLTREAGEIRADAIRDSEGKVPDSDQ